MTVKETKWSTFQIDILFPEHEDGEINTTHFIKTDADKMSVQTALDFVKRANKKEIEAVLVAIRVLGFTAREVKVEAEEVFEL